MNMKKQVQQLENAAKQPKSQSRTAFITAATNRIFDRYEKTFRDLARYDKGDKVSSN